MLDHRMAFHHATLVEHLVNTDPHVLERVATLERTFMSQGFTAGDAHVRALALLQGMLMRQGSVMSFNDTFFVTAFLVLAFLPLVFLLGKPQGNASVSGAH
jgi:DHA2 family multidrug resistance protein